MAMRESVDGDIYNGATEYFEGRYEAMLDAIVAGARPHFPTVLVETVETIVRIAFPKAALALGEQEGMSYQTVAEKAIANILTRLT